MRRQLCVRDAIETTYPDQFKDFNNHMFTPGGFPRPLGARERKWKTPNGKANFIVPDSLNNRREQAPDIYQLRTLRGEGQFNTTIYAEMTASAAYAMALMNQNDIARLHLHEDDLVTLSTAADDAASRRLAGLRVRTGIVQPHSLIDAAICATCSGGCLRALRSHGRSAPMGQRSICACFARSILSLWKAIAIGPWGGRHDPQTFHCRDRVPPVPRSHGLAQHGARVCFSKRHVGRAH
jgi:hypothetical protein